MQHRFVVGGFAKLVFLSQWLAALVQPAVGEAGWAVMDEVPSLHDSKRKA